MTEERYRVGLTRTLVQHIASSIDAYKLCCEKPDAYPEWKARHLATAKAAVACLPSGSGIDQGPTLDIDASNAEKICLDLSYHHMDEHGGYDGWTDHTVTVRPSLIHTVKLTISGRDRNATKDYLYDAYQTALTDYYVEVYIIPEDRSVFIESAHLEAFLAPNPTVADRGVW